MRACLRHLDRFDKKKKGVNYSVSLCYWNAIYKCKWVVLSWYVQLRGYEILRCRNIFLSLSLSLSLRLLSTSPLLSFPRSLTFHVQKAQKLSDLWLMFCLSVWWVYTINVTGIKMYDVVFSCSKKLVKSWKTRVFLLTTIEKKARGINICDELNFWRHSRP